MRFIFTGFSQITGFRVFAYECIEKDKTPTKLTVRADINLGRKHGIHLQDWPLLCLEMLERRADDMAPGTSEFSFDEDRMREYAEARAVTRLTGLLKRKAKPAVANALPKSQPTAPVFSTAVFVKKW